MASQREWPRGKEGGASKNSPVGRFLTADGFLNSERSVAGPLRTGTAPGVGPSGPAGTGDTDFGMDRVAGDFDPMGTSRNRSGEFPRATRLRRNTLP